MARKNASLTRMEGPEGLKWELGFAYFWLGKWDFMHFHQQRNNRKWD
jgi:hypothetical protein